MDELGKLNEKLDKDLTDAIAGFIKSDETGDENFDYATYIIPFKKKNDTEIEAEITILDPSPCTNNTVHREGEMPCRTHRLRKQNLLNIIKKYYVNKMAAWHKHLEKGREGGKRKSKRANKKRRSSRKKSSKSRRRR